MTIINITGEYGIVIRKAALKEKGVLYTDLLNVMEVGCPLDENDDLISFGPSFGEEALNEFIIRLKSIQLEYVDDFFIIIYDVPKWCKLMAKINNC
jgi:hypothetical protein